MDLLECAVDGVWDAELSARVMANELGLCSRCAMDVWRPHMKRGGRLRPRSWLHPWVIVRLILWRVLVHAKWGDTGYPPAFDLKRDIGLWSGTADLYVAAHRSSIQGVRTAA